MPRRRDRFLNKSLRRSSNRSPEQSYSLLNRDVDREVGLQFIKKYRFQEIDDEDPPELPPLDTLFTTSAYSVEKLQKIKRDLNAVKSRLNDFEISNWHQHTRRRSSLYAILHELRTRVRGEFVTQAFAKLYECVASYDLVPEGQKEFYSVHLCEAPGAFITGLNHFIKSKRENVRWQWFANTLNPYYEGNCMGNMITDDRFILHTVDSWCFGEDYTGDVMERQNLDAIVRRSKEFPEINLVTADGSIDCLDVPEAQEEHVAKLHLAEAVTAMKMLTKGGSLILKMFTLFEHSSVDLLYLLYASFGELHVFKPCTSKPGNSEVYVIAKKYRKPTGIDKYLDRIFDNLHSSANNSIFDVKLLPGDFVDEVYDCAYEFMILQQDVIEHNIYYYQKTDKLEEERLRKFKTRMCHRFFEIYQITGIPFSEAILHGIDIVSGVINVNPRDSTGTYNERSLISSMSGDSRLTMLREKLENLVANRLSFLPRSKFTDRPMENVRSCQETIHFSCGKTINSLFSSKFVTLANVRFLNACIDAVTPHLPLPKESNAALFTLDRFTYTLTINVKAYAAVSSYNLYEKKLFRILFKCITELPLQEDVDHFTVQNWMLLTQFSVGVVWFLKTYVFDRVTPIDSNQLRFSGLKPDGIASLQYLNEGLQSEEIRDAPAKAVLGILPIRLLFDGGFYYAVMNYNNALCLSYCSTLLEASTLDETTQ